MNAEKIAELRRRWGLTQADVAKIMEVSSALIVSQWENGYRNPSGIVKKLFMLLDKLPTPEARSLLRWLQSIELTEKERRKTVSRRKVK